MEKKFFWTEVNTQFLLTVHTSFLCFARFLERGRGPLQVNSLFGPFTDSVPVRID